jgi:NAD(P)-dependent dehydrogenase (short-subunit alcohol dehydrogenase family)
MSQDQRFLGKKIIITGGGGYLGREGCLYFSQRGAFIAALDKSPKALQETVEAIKKQVGEDAVIIAVECDVTNVESVQSAVETVVTKLGGIDMLWNNAGYQGQIKPTLEYDPADFNMVMNINVTGMFIVLQAVAKHMAQHNGGSIVNTASVAGLACTPAMVAYASSKAAVLAMTVSCSKVCLTCLRGCFVCVIYGCCADLSCDRIWLLMAFV